MAEDVLCEVENCTFWEKGNRCTASHIQIISHKGNKARNEKETDCQTFKPSN